MMSVMQVVLSVERRFPGRGRQTMTRGRKNCSITHGCAKMTLLTVQKVDTGGLFLSKEKECIASCARSTTPTLLRISKRNSPQSLQ